jgi:hypothetical protein
MNPGEASTLDSQRYVLLARLQAADSSLRASLHQHGTDALVRAHLERALAHIREAHIAVRERIQIRTVQELADQLARIEQMREDLRAQQTTADESATSIHV